MSTIGGVAKKAMKKKMLGVGEGMALGAVKGIKGGIKTMPRPSTGPQAEMMRGILKGAAGGAKSGLTEMKKLPKWRKTAEGKMRY